MGLIISFSFDNSKNTLKHSGGVATAPVVVLHPDAAQRQYSGVHKIVDLQEIPRRCRLEPPLRRRLLGRVDWLVRLRMFYSTWIAASKCVRGVACVMMVFENISTAVNSRVCCRHESHHPLLRMTNTCPRVSSPMRDLWPHLRSISKPHSNCWVAEKVLSFFFCSRKELRTRPLIRTKRCFPLMLSNACDSIVRDVWLLPARTILRCWFRLA